MKRSFLEKADWFYVLGQGEPRPLEKTLFDMYGKPALDCFHALESRGQRVPCREPEKMDAYLVGKQQHGITVAMVAEDFAINRLITSQEVRDNYPGWVAREIFAQAQKQAAQKIGFVPTFVRDGEDYSALRMEPT